MPSFTTAVADLVVQGPLVQLLVGPSKSFTQSVGAQNIATPQTILALVDTGASGTVLTPAVVQQLGIQPVSAVLFRSGTSAPRCFGASMCQSRWRRAAAIRCADRAFCDGEDGRSHNTTHARLVDSVELAIHIRRVPQPRLPRHAPRRLCDHSALYAAELGSPHPPCASRKARERAQCVR